MTLLFLLGLSLFFPTISAHFMLPYPPALTGSNSDTELSTSPCGLNSTAPLFNNLTSPTTTLSTSSFPLYLSTEAQQQRWLFRATTDKAQPFRWTNLLPVVEQTARGSFCVPDLSLPRSFMSREALIQVIQQHDGGLSYQCATISFVADMPTTMTPLCQNATGLEATVTNLDDLPALNSNSANPSSNATMTGSSNMGNMTATPTTDHHHHSATDEAGTAETAKSAAERILASAGIAGVIAMGFWMVM